MKRVNTILVVAVLALASLSAYAQPWQIGTSDVYWEISNDTLYLTGYGDMPDFTVTPPWYSSSGSLTCVQIESGITKIGNYAFRNCSLTSATIPSTITVIGDRAFYYCDKLGSINIPNSVITIGEFAFIFCYNLTSIVIPYSVSTIGSGAFAFCPLTSINVDAGNLNYSSQDGVLYNFDKTTLVAYPTGKTDTNYIIPNSVTVIGGGAFDGCRKLTSVSIPNSVKTISKSAFESSGLTSISIPNSVTSIGYAAFNGCTKLTSVIIPDSITVIEGNAFAQCFELSFVRIPNSVTSIKLYAFGDSYGLTSITIPASVISIENLAFERCTALTEVVNLNPTPQSINANVFEEVNLSACTLKVAEPSVAVYQTEPVWEDFALILGCYHVDVAANNDAYGAVSGGGFIHEDTLRAIPNAGYAFVNWTNQEGEELSTANPFVFTPTQDTVIIGVFREKNTDATLKSLGVSSGTLSPSFHKDSMSYAVEVAHEIVSITLAAEATDNNAVITGDTGTHALPASGVHNFTITVTAEDGITVLSYTVVATRLPGSDATLQELTVSEGVLAPAFSPSTISYAVTVESTVQVVVVNALTTHENATVEGIGAIVFSNDEKQKTATLTVTAEDSITTKTYTVTIVRTGVGIMEAEAGERVSMYPNPVSNTLYIEASSAIEQLSIYDLNGRMVLTKEQQQENISIDVSSLPSGIYLVRVKTENSETIKKLTIEN